MTVPQAQPGLGGSPVSQYAPFYLWADVGSAATFLWQGTGFDGIVRDYGRPSVNTCLNPTTSAAVELVTGAGFAPRTQRG